MLPGIPSLNRYRLQSGNMTLQRPQRLISIYLKKFETQIHKFYFYFNSRPSSPKNTRQAPAAPQASSKQAAPSGFPVQQQATSQMNYNQPAPSQMNYNQPAPSQMNYNNQNQAPPQQPTQSGLNLNITPGNLITAFQTATSLTNTFNSIKDKVQPPSRPAPMPNNASQNSLPNPLIPS